MLAFLNKKKRLIWYSVLYTVPVFYWVYCLFYVDPFSYYHPELSEHNVRADMTNSVFFVIMDHNPSFQEIKSMRYLRTRYCFDNDDFDKYASNIIVYVPDGDVPKANVPADIFFQPTYPEKNVFLQLKDFEFLEEYQYAYLLKFPDTRIFPVRYYCEEIIHDSIATVDSENTISTTNMKYSTFITGGSLENFKKMIDDISQTCNDPNADSAFFERVLNEHLEKNQPEIVVALSRFFSF